MGGILPPELFGVDARLGFDSEAEAAAFNVADGQIDLSAEGWVLKLKYDGSGRVAAETELVFKLIFEDQVRTVRCRPGDPPVGSVTIMERSKFSEVSGHFDLELVHCEDAETGEPLGWPPKPFILRGSLDRLNLKHQTE